jgi:uncharacterized protein HemX
MAFNWLEILLAIGGTSGITTILTLQIQRRKGKAEAGQEEAKAHQEDVKAKKDLADLERDIYTRLISTVNTELETRDKKIDTLQETQNNLLKTIDLQNGNIKHLQKMVDDYKATCDNCQVRIDKTKKAVK